MDTFRPQDEASVLARVATLSPNPCAQSAKTARNSAAENLEGVRAAVAAEDVLEAAQKASIAACRAHSVRAPSLKKPFRAPHTTSSTRSEP